MGGYYYGMGSGGVAGRATAGVAVSSFPQNAVLDTFNRANEGPPMTGWAENVAGAGYKVLSNAAIGTGAFSVSRYTATGTMANAEAWATVAAKPTVDAQNMGVGCRMTTGSSYDAYFFFGTNKTGTDTLAIWKVVAGVYTKISSDVTQEYNVGDKLGVKAVGTTISGWVYTAGAWSKAIEMTDSSVSAAGYIGMAGDVTFQSWDDFGGGTAT